MKTVSFETAKLAKEKGFDYLEDMYYDTEGNLRIMPVHDGRNFCCYASEQEEMCSWLRINKDIHVTADIDVCGQWFPIVNRISRVANIIPVKEMKSYSSYEEALEAGIIIALEDIM